MKSLLVSLFVCLLAMPGQRSLYAALPDIGMVKTDASELRQATVHLSAAGVIAKLPVIPSAWQQVDRMFGELNLQQLEVGFSKVCATRFVQHKDAGIYALCRIRRLLFPVHYYW